MYLVLIKMMDMGFRWMFSDPHCNEDLQVDLLLINES